jgi:NAD+ diphosphatase
MKTAEQVTFGGSELDRADELRGKADRLEALTEAVGARSILIWRGKPLVVSTTLDRLARLPMDHPVLARCAMPPIFLGREDGGALLFAHDISTWTPSDMDVSALGTFLDPTEQQHPDLPDAMFVELRRIMTRLSRVDAEAAATARAILGWHVSHRFCAACGQESVMTQSGWQRDCPACGTSHFPRTDPVVIMLITRGNSVLLGRSPGWPEGMHSLLAGFIEPGETLEAAVRREVFEEAGIRVGAVTYLASQPWPFPSSLMLGCRGDALTEEITIDPGEIEAAIWVTREDLLEARDGKNPALLPARKGAIAHFLLENWLADRLD